MDSEAHHHHQLRILFFPFLAHGHMLPLVEMARLFAERGVKATIATTNGNVFRIRRTIEEATRSDHSMQLLLLPFPSAEVSLTPGVEHTASLSPASLSDIIKFHQGNQLLRQPLEELLRNPDNTPDYIISDTIYSWTSDLALSLGIPRLVFHGTSPFSLCISDHIESHSTHIAVSGDAEPSVVPGGLPHRIELTKSELPITFNYPQALERFRDADERKSYGAVLNSFYELAPEYVELCKMGGERKVWCVGPVWLCNRTDVEKAGRGGELHGEQGFGDIARELARLEGS